MTRNKRLFFEGGNAIVKEVLRYGKANVKPKLTQCKIYVK